jgi:transketolase
MIGSMFHKYCVGAQEMKNIANAIRFLSIDMVEAAKSGHPGMPMGMADIAAVLYKDFLKFNPHDTTWPNRDRFIVSNGHGSALLYSCLYLSGYEKMTLDELKRFRQIGSITPGHLEMNKECSIETTTGPLGQGLANAVGFALAERMMNARFGNELVNHKTYVFCGDGCLAEGVGQEAIALAGHLGLKNLIVLFDDNGITIDGPTSLSTSEDHIKRFEAAGWNAMRIDGHDYEQIKNALKIAQSSDKPIMIACKTKIGWGAPNKAGFNFVHGAPLGKEEAALTRNHLGWEHPAFVVPDEILRDWRSFAKRSEPEYIAWSKRYESKGADFHKFINKTDLIDVSKVFADLKAAFYAEADLEASRVSSGKVLYGIARDVLNLIGGSADLTGSNNTRPKYFADISKGSYAGRYVNYGEREHLMAAMMNGMALYGGFIPYAGTFLTFSDYCKPAIRLSAMMRQQVIYIMTHDSIGLGEDGPTHQAVEHLAGLRAIPHLRVYRPADNIETLECYELALKDINTPSLFALSRQPLPRVRLDNEAANLASYGGYIIKEAESELEVTIFATGSEVAIALQTAKILENIARGVRVVSVPCIELLFEQDAEYLMMLTCNNSLKVGVEAASSFGWERLIGSHGLFFGVDSFGHSGPYKEVYKHFGLEAQHISSKISEILKMREDR